jgi:RND family efflux transporter MFP subunit
MYVYFNVDERSLIRYRQIFAKGKEDRGKSVEELHIPVYVALEGEQGYPHEGTIDFVDNKVNPGTGTIQVRGILPTEPNVYEDGMRARVRVPVGAPYEALLVTEQALGSEQGRKYVYVVNAKNVVERRDVTLGRLIDGLQVIQHGLEPGDWVIVNGIQRVRDAMEVRPQQAAMPGAK